MWKEKFYQCYYAKGITGETINEVCIPFKNEHIPKKLYHYTKAKYGKKILEENLMYLPKIDDFNDPYEAYIFFNRINLEKFAFDYAVNSLENSPRRKGRDLKKDKIKEIIQDIVKNQLEEEIENFKSNLSIICLSESNDSNPMWGNYAEKFYGICIEYNLRDLEESYLKNFCFPVEYVERFDAEKNESHLVLSDLTLYEPVLKKSQDWSYEQEWRIIVDKRREIVQDMIETEGKKEYLEFITPSAVYLGCRIDENYETELVEICRENDIKVCKMKIDESNYNFYFEDALE